MEVSCVCFSSAIRVFSFPLNTNMPSLSETVQRMRSLKRVLLHGPRTAKTETVGLLSVCMCFENAVSTASF